MLFTMTDVRTVLVLVGMAILSTAACREAGVVSVHRIPGTAGGGAGASGTQESHAGDPTTGEPAGPCPSGWNCMDLSALGLQAKDQDGKSVTFSCGMGTNIMACNDDDPAGSCKGLEHPICAHIEVSGMKIVSCAQRCSP